LGEVLVGFYDFEVFYVGLGGRGSDSVFFIKFLLDAATAVGFSEGFYDTFGEGVGIEDDFTVGISGSTSDDLDEGGGGTQKSLFVAV
jgi:hypothetical protein